MLPVAATLITPEQRLREGIDCSDPGLCWFRDNGDAVNGYSQIYINGRVLGAHVYAWMLAHPGEPEPRVVRHRCPGEITRRNRRCINPAHLLEGDVDDNVHDRDADGNTAKGESHHAAKLTEADVREIRRRHAAGESALSLAAAFGVTDVNIYDIVNRKSWKHVL